MRVFTLAVGTLGLANFVVGGVVPSKSTSTSVHVSSTGPILTRTVPPLPTRSIHTAPHFEKRAESSPAVTAFIPSCSPGYTYLPTMDYSYTSCDSHGRSCIPLTSWPTSSCIQTMCSSGSTPYLPIWTRTSCTEMTTKPEEPVTTSCTGKPTTGTLMCWYTSPNWGGTRSPRMVADFAARTTQAIEGRGQPNVARSADPTTTPSPTICPPGATPRPPFYLTSRCPYDWDHHSFSCTTWSTTWTDGVSSTCTSTLR